MYLFRVLIVDDEPMVVDEVSTLLMSWDNMCLDILMAYTAKDALEIVQKGRIDILITDIEMPEMNGLELMKRAEICKDETVASLIHDCGSIRRLLITSINTAKANTK